MASGSPRRYPLKRARTTTPQPEIAPIERLARLAGTPLLLIHGTRDRWIPLAQARRLIDAAPGPCEAWVVEGAIHCGAYFVDRAAYCERVASFFTRHLGRSEAA